jgi:hypothetical protein
MTVTEWQLTVDRAEFARALRAVARMARGMAVEPVCLRFARDLLSIQAGGTTEEVAASGQWPRRVSFQGEYLSRVVRALPRVDPLPLRVAAGRLYFAKFSILCEVVTTALPAKETILPDPDLFELLVLRARCSPEEIDATGATVQVTEARARLGKICAETASVLRAYRVSPDAIRALCERKIEQGERRFREGDAAAVALISKVWAKLAFLGVEPGEIKELMDEALRNAWKSS